MNWVRGSKRNIMPECETAPAPKNDPKLLRFVSVHVLRPFCVKGLPLTIGDKVVIEYHVARDMVALGKAAIVYGPA